uniref:Uncharacterized protein n=1 Tax=Arcella intermedia TaxID=1963864 RepID=A0A6B2LM16_9EUKA
MRKLDLRKNKMGVEGVKVLAALFARNETLLDDIFLFHNGISDEGVSHLAEALKAYQGLKKLNLCQNEIGKEGAKALGSLLAVNESLEALDLNNNPLADDGAAFLVDSLSRNKSLLSISMWNTRITDRTASLFIQLLQSSKNVTLRKINLHQNDISPPLLLQLKQLLPEN